MTKIVNNNNKNIFYHYLLKLMYIYCYFYKYKIKHIFNFKNIKYNNFKNINKVL